MRWEDYDKPPIGSFRIVSRFLWWPTCFCVHWRWLERADIVQKFVAGAFDDHWRSISFAHPAQIESETFQRRLWKPEER